MGLRNPFNRGGALVKFFPRDCGGTKSTTIDELNDYNNSNSSNTTQSNHAGAQKTKRRSSWNKSKRTNANEKCGDAACLNFGLVHLCLLCSCLSSTCALAYLMFCLQDDEGSTSDDMSTSCSHEALMLIWHFLIDTLSKLVGTVWGKKNIRPTLRLIKSGSVMGHAKHNSRHGNINPNKHNKHVHIKLAKGKARFSRRRKANKSNEDKLFLIYMMKPAEWQLHKEKATTNHPSSVHCFAGHRKTGMALFLLFCSCCLISGCPAMGSGMPKVCLLKVSL